MCIYRSLVLILFNSFPGETIYTIQYLVIRIDSKPLQYKLWPTLKVEPVELWYMYVLTTIAVQTLANFKSTVEPVDLYIIFTEFKRAVALGIYKILIYFKRYIYFNPFVPKLSF